MKPIKIFVVEDDPWYRELLSYHLEDPEHEVHAFESAKACLSALSLHPDIITLDYRLPDSDGGKLLEQIKSTHPDTEVLIISAQENIETAVQLVKSGAYDYFVKTPDIQERLRNAIRRIRTQQGLQKELSVLRKEVARKYEFSQAIVGQSPALQKVFALMDKAIQTHITVSISGETGTGKELVAKAIHFNSSRKSFPFVALNLAAIPKELIESELFGHEKGAFTGAQQKRIGKFEEAHKGTLFLDEIGEMDISLQAKLLRALQEKEITRVGGNKNIPTDCRIIVATHRNLQAEVKKGAFREDLFYRLYGLPIELPPLRERGADILLLARHFLHKFSEENGLGTLQLNTLAQQKLLAHTYPGNIRELKSVVELAAVMTNTQEIEPEHIMFSSAELLPEVLSEEKTLREYSDQIIDIYMKRYNNNVRLVAEKLDIGVATIYRRIN